MAELANYYGDLSSLSEALLPGLARYYQSEAAYKKEGKGVMEAFQNQICFFCGNSLLPSNHHIRLLPRRQLTAKVRRLLTRSASATSQLGPYQRKLVKDYMESCNRLCVTCHICKKTMLIQGQTRAMRVQQLQLQKQMVATPTDVAVKSKRQKKRDKAAARMKRKLCEDSNAGLSLPSSRAQESDPVNRSDGQSPTVDSSTPASQHAPVTTSLIPSDQQTLAVSAMAIHSHQPAVSTMAIHSHQPAMSVSVLRSDQKKVRSAPQPLVSASWGSTASKSSKKKKALKMSKQLGQMLKKESSKRTNSGPSLTDFLSSL